MNPVDFPESNANFGPPPDVTETQVATVRAYHGAVFRGSLQGAHIVIVAWKPTPEELRDITEGKPIFLSCIGGLPPHFLTTNFAEANSPS